MVLTDRNAKNNNRCMLVHHCISFLEWGWDGIARLTHNKVLSKNCSNQVLPFRWRNSDLGTNQSTHTQKKKNTNFAKLLLRNESKHRPSGFTACFDKT